MEENFMVKIVTVALGHAHGNNDQFSMCANSVVTMHFRGGMN